MTSDESPDLANPPEKLLVRLKQVLEATATTVWEVDLVELSVDHFGPVEQVTGVPPEELADPMAVAGRVIHPDDQNRAIETFVTQLTAGTQTIDIEFRTNPANGPARWLRTQASVDYDDDGQPTTLVGLSSDITPLKEEEARLEAFAGVVSHDLRNPLAVAKGWVELIRDEHDVADLEHVDNALDRMEVLIENLLTFARAEESNMEIGTVDLASISKDAWETVDTADASFVILTDRTVRADSLRLRQLLENLFRNAVEHGGDDVAVTVGDLEDGVYVEDDGVGIPDDERELLFARRLGATDTKTGLGLRIVKQIVDGHGWEIGAVEAAGGGTRFEITGVGPV